MSEHKTTSYVVLVSQEVKVDAIALEVVPEAPTWTAWREVAVLDVPQRTTRATVVEQAKEHARPFVDGRAQLRVYPLAEHIEADLELVSQPELRVTLR